MKKLLLNLGSISAVAIPTAAVIACSKKHETPTYVITDETTRTDIIGKMNVALGLAANATLFDTTQLVMTDNSITMIVAEEGIFKGERVKKYDRVVIWYKELASDHTKYEGTIQIFPFFKTETFKDRTLDDKISFAKTDLSGYTEFKAPLKVDIQFTRDNASQATINVQTSGKAGSANIYGMIINKIGEANDYKSISTVIIKENGTLIDTLDITQYDAHGIKVTESHEKAITNLGGLVGAGFLTILDSTTKIHDLAYKYY